MKDAPKADYFIYTFATADAPDTQLTRSGDSWYCAVDVQIPFLPLGLLLWGTTSETRVHTVSTGNRHSLSVNLNDDLPGSLFDPGDRSLEAVLEDAKAGKLAVLERFELGEMLPGMMLTLRASGPCRKVAYWGKTYRDGVPRPRSASVALDKNSVWRGKLFELRLAGRVELLEVEAPTPEVAAQLLSLGSTTARY